MQPFPARYPDMEIVGSAICALAGRTSCLWPMERQWNPIDPRALARGDIHDPTMPLCLHEEANDCLTHITTREQSLPSGVYSLGRGTFCDTRSASLASPSLQLRAFAELHVDALPRHSKAFGNFPKRQPLLYQARQGCGSLRSNAGWAAPPFARLRTHRDSSGCPEGRALELSNLQVVPSVVHNRNPWTQTLGHGREQR